MRYWETESYKNFFVSWSLLHARKPLIAQLAETGYPIKLISDQLKGPSKHIASVVLSSAQLIADFDVNINWEYRSLADAVNANFVCGFPVHYRNLNGLPAPNWWIGEAQRYSQEFGMVIGSVTDEGLKLYIKGMADAYVEADSTNESYRRAIGLASEPGYFNMSLDTQPAWASELFLWRPNYEAHRLIFYEQKGTPENNIAHQWKALAVNVLTQQIESGKPLDSLLKDLSLVAQSKGSKVVRQPDTQESPGKVLTTKERNSFLVTIAALCKLAKVDYTKHAGSAKAVVAAADELGVSIGDTTVENILKSIHAVLEKKSR
jgi:hypothetical protein